MDKVDDFDKESASASGRVKKLDKILFRQDSIRNLQILVAQYHLAPSSRVRQAIRQAKLGA